MGINLFNEGRWLWKQASKAVKPTLDQAARTVAPVLDKATKTVSHVQSDRKQLLASHADVRREQMAARNRDIAPERHNSAQKGVLDLLDKAGQLGNGFMAAQERFLKDAGERTARLAGSLPVVGGVASGFVRSQVRSITLFNEFSQGIVKGLGSNVGGLVAAAATPKKTALGLVDLAAHLPIPANPLRLAQEVFRARQSGGDVRAAVAYALDPDRMLKDDASFFEAVGKGLVSNYNESWQQGRYVEALGKLTFDIVSVVGTGGGGAAAKSGKALDAVADVATVGHRLAGAADDMAIHGSALAGAADDVAIHGSVLAGSADDVARASHHLDDVLGGVKDALENATDIGDKVASRQDRE